MDHDADRVHFPGPSASSWLSAALLYGVFLFWAMLGGNVVPRIVELIEESPQLAALAGAGYLLSPALGVMVSHHTLHGVLDGLDGERGVFRFAPGAASAWAGVFAWGTLMLSTMLSLLLLAALFAGKGGGGAEALAAAARAPLAALEGGERLVGLVHLGTWLSISAWCYDLERRMKAAAARGDRRV